MTRKRHEWIILLVLPVLFYLLPYLCLRETVAFKIPVMTDYAKRKPLPHRIGSLLDKTYTPLVWLDRKITGRTVTFVPSAWDIRVLR